MSYLRSDIRSEVRDNLNETTADLWTDAQLNKYIRAEIRSLPRKRVYLEEVWSTNTEVDKIEYPLPSSNFKVESVERNWGTSSQPDWQPVGGWDQYGNTLELSFRPVEVFTMRIKSQMRFTDLSDDVTTSDIPDDKMDIVIWGTVVRAYKALMGYFIDAKNWDAIAKPDGISMNQVLNWLMEAKKEYKELLQVYKTSQRPRDINLVD